MRFLAQLAVTSCAAILGSGGAMVFADTAPEKVGTEAAAAAPTRPAKPTWDLDFEPPPGAEWLKDEEGLEYFLEEIPLFEGYYKWENAERTEIRIVYGARYRVESIDDEKKTVKIRIYKPIDSAPPAKPQLSAEERERRMSEYRFEPPVADRLRFAPLAPTLPARGQWRHGFDLADFNGDKILDIVHGPPRKGGEKPVVFLGDGKGGFASWPAVTFPADAAIDYGDVAAADFNRDGQMDVAAASHLRGIQVFVGDGKGTFKRWSRGVEFHPSGEIDNHYTFSSRALIAADWNGDGRPDLVANGEGPRLAIALQRSDAKYGAGARGLRVYLNKGNGTWTPIADPGSRNYGDGLTVGDLDGDKRLDAFASSSVRGYKALLNLQKPDGSWHPTILEGLRPSGNLHAVLAEDIDGDGQTDLVLGFVNHDPALLTWHLGIDLFLRRGAGWERRLLYGVEGKDAFVSALAAGDLDGDKRKDLVAFDNMGGSIILLADGKGGFQRQASEALFSGDLGCRGYHVRLADLDSDGRLEIVASFAGEYDQTFRDLVGAPILCRSGGSLKVWDVLGASAGVAGGG